MSPNKDYADGLDHEFTSFHLNREPIRRFASVASHGRRKRKNFPLLASNSAAKWVRLKNGIWGKLPMTTPRRDEVAQNPTSQAVVVKVVYDFSRQTCHSDPAE
jgi:hypothetical protein